jgi:hypothetical protein
VKYLSNRQILESLDHLSGFNQFFGLTFLAAKSALLPVGKTTDISLDSLNHKFLQNYYSLDPRSEYFFRVFRFNNAHKYWLQPGYHGKGLQKLNTSTFKDAFIHEKKSKKWGWRESYVDFLAQILDRRLIPIFHLACWLYRDQAWDDTSIRDHVTQRLCSDFNLTQEEQEKLFLATVTTNIDESAAFQNVPVSWQEIESEFESPPDVGPDKGGILTYLDLESVGPVSPLRFEPGSRLNMITGDNGLGKTFLLDVAWWALTGIWSDRPAYPNRRPDSAPKGKIKFQISGSGTGKPQTITYAGNVDKWPEPKNRATISGLVVYARVDGSYAVWDPAGSSTSGDGKTILVFGRDEVWDGKPGRIEGLVRDWTKWQDKPKKYPFDVFLKVLACMSPPEMGPLTPGEPVRLPFDPREIPTLKHSYGDVPILHESAGIRRIISLAYLMVWTWNEHRILSQQLGRMLESRMVVMVDEMEAHLHPRWQRIILPALLNVARILSSNLEMQILAASHSPLVLASAESVFDPVSDKLFHLEASKSGHIAFHEIPFIKYGAVNSWLTSNIFDLKHARSREAETAIGNAIDLQKEEEPDNNEILKVSNMLAKHLPAEDQFWARWVFFAQDHGVEM